MKDLKYPISLSVSQLKNRIKKVKSINKNVHPSVSGDIYYCATCGSKDQKAHPESGYCFHCDTDNWIPEYEWLNFLNT